LLIAALGACLAVATVMAISFAGIRAGTVGAGRTDLLRYQLGKLDAAGSAEVLLLGDSTLGNTVDAAGWERALGRPVRSLALTGSYGYGGTLNMLRRSLRRGQPQLVVLMHTIEAPGRRAEWEGLVYTAEELGDLAEAPPWEIVAGLANLDLPREMLYAWLAGPRPADPRLVERDYEPQQPPGPDGVWPGVEGQRLARQDMREDRMRLLDRIGALCRAEAVPCLYAHGPYVEPLCSAAVDFLEAANRRIEQAGLQVVDNTPVCIQREDIGDSEDHVAPRLRDAYSELHRQLVMAEAAALGVELPARP